MLENLEFLKKFDFVLEDTSQKVSDNNDLEKIEITLNNLSFNFKDKKIFNNLNIKILSNSFISIFGESGTGKSTLLNIVLGLFKPSSGEVLVNEKNINQDIDFGFLRLDMLIKRL